MALIISIKIPEREMCWSIKGDTGVAEYIMEMRKAITQDNNTINCNAYK